MKTCLTIAGSDSSGGAGIQADLKTFAALNVYGMSAITALTAQNTLGVQGVSAVKPDFVALQIRSVIEDIFPDAVKIGMLANTEIINHVAQELESFNANNVVLDPVMIATSGDPLLDQQSVRSLIDNLMPNVDIITPNVAELISLCKAQAIKFDYSQAITTSTLKALSIALSKSLPTKKDGAVIAILSKGGHLENEDAIDYFFDGKNEHWLRGSRIETNNTHGTGCTLSSAICAQLAKSDGLQSACVTAKDYLTMALSKQLNLGQGNGPLEHSL